MKTARVLLLGLLAASMTFTASGLGGFSPPTPPAFSLPEPAHAQPMLGRLLNGLLPDNAALPDTPIPSFALGETASPQGLVERYAARAQAQPEPLRDGLHTWSRFIAAHEDPLILERGLQRGEQWPRPVQEAIAVLLYALTDASHHQSSALQSLSGDEILRLVRHLPDVVRLPPDALGEDQPQDILTLASRIDMAPILSGAALLTQAVDHSLPVLQEWADVLHITQPEQQRLRQLYEGLDAAATQSSSPDASLQRTQQVLALGAVALGITVPRPRPPLAGNDLESALVQAGAALGQTLDGLADQDLSALPQDIQQALAAIVAAYADHASANPGPASTQFGNVLHLLEAVRVALPTLKKWSLIYEHLGPNLPKAGPAKLAPILALAQLAAAPDAPPESVVRLGGMLTGTPWVAPLSRAADLEPDLVEEVRRMYAFRGIPATAADVARLETGAAHLAPSVAASAADLLRALNDGEASIAEAQRRIAYQHKDFLMTDGPGRAAHALVAAAPSWDDVEALSEFFQIVDDLNLATHGAAQNVLAAADRARQSLAPPTFGTLASDIQVAPQRSTWDAATDAAYDGFIWFLDHMTPLGLLGTASAQAPTPGPAPMPGCPQTSPLSACANDIWFADPVLKWVVISGADTTVYDPTLIRGGATFSLDGQEKRFDGRGQMLTLDLGGNDVYRNNAGGVLVGEPELASQLLSGAQDLMPSPGVRGVDTFRVALALDLGGNDRYESPPPSFAQAGIQGAGIGGVGILWDVAGDNTYAATTQAQGFGGGTSIPVQCPQTCARIPVPGLGILISTGGADRYTASDRAQGMGEGLALTMMPINAGLSGPGIGILFDRAGNDEYRILAHDAAGIGSGIGGVGLLLDANGDDTYSGGSQGAVPSAPRPLPTRSQALGCVTGTPGCIMMEPDFLRFGVAILVDFGGHDSYSRSRPPTTDRMSDGDCWTSVAFPQRDPLEGAAVRDEGGPTGAPITAPTLQVPFADETYATTRTQLGVFIDLPSTEDPCRFDPEPLIPPAAKPQPSVPAPDPDQITVTDTDQDGWPDGVEYILGTNPDDPNEFPAGWPSRPPSWPDTVPYPPAPDAFPEAGPNIIDLPGLFALGDVTGGEYPAGKDYAVLVALGGTNVYHNCPGGIAPGTTGAPAFALDIGGNDHYLSPPACLGSNGILIDAEGDDRYESDAKSMGYATPADPRRLALGLLADLQGNDAYVANGIAMGAIEDAVAPSHVVAQHVALGIMLDTDGDDTYDGPTQGRAMAGTRLPSGGLGLFADLQGTDTYVRVGEQGTTKNTRQVLDDAAFAQLVAGAFFDGSGWDTYTVDNQRGGLYDVSRQHNNAARVTTRNEESERDLPPSLASLASPVQTFGVRVDTNSSANTRLDPECAADPGPEATCPTDDSFLVEFPGLGVAVSDDASDMVFTEDYALLITAGGNNIYRNNAGGSLFRLLGATTTQTQQPSDGAGLGGVDQPADLRPSPIAALLLDLGGDDHYDGLAHTGPGRSDIVRHNLPYQGTSIPFVTGVTVNVPTAPSPFLIPTALRRGTFVQGTGFLGTGILIDSAGSDAYVAHALSQGAGAWGVGLLWDRRGDDTYTFDPEVARAPVLGSIMMIHETLLNDRWTLSNNPTLPGESRHPSLATGRLAFQNDATGEWKVYVDTDPLNPNPALLDARPGEQVSPRTDGHTYAWTDNADGPWQIRARSLDAAPRTLSEAPPGSNQLRPDVHGDWVVWQDNRNGSWDIRAKNLKTNADVLVADDSLRAEVEPRIFGDWVAWKESSGAAPDAPTFRARNLATGETITLGQGPELTQGPVVGPGFILFAKRTTSGDTLQHVDLATRKTTTLAATRNAPCLFDEPSGIGGLAVNPDHHGQAVYTLNKPGASTTLPAGTPLTAIQSVIFADATGRQVPKDATCNLRVDPNLLLGSGTVPPQPGDTGQVPADVSTKAGLSIAFLQGAVAQHGRGLLIEEGGSDLFAAVLYAQGAGRSVDVPRMPVSDAAQNLPNPGVPAQLNGGLNVRPQPDQAMFAILADLGGNDRYLVNQYGQGSHDAVTGYQMASVSEPEAGSTTVLLLDLQGDDEYRADRFSQGWAGLTLGHWGGRLRFPQPPAPPVPIPRLAFTTFAAASSATFVDLGGRDAYRYGAEEGLRSRLQQDDDGAAQVDLNASLDNEPFVIPGPDLPACSSLFSLEACESIGPAFSLARAPVEGRNNYTWSQRGAPVRGPPDPPGVGPDNPNWCVNTASSPVIDDCPPILVVGGIGVDRDAAGALLEPMRRRLEATYEVHVMSPTSTSTGSLHGQAVLAARVDRREASSTPVATDAEPHGVDFFLRHVDETGPLLMLDRGVPIPSIGCQYCVRWNTEDGTYADGTYEVVAVATFGTPHSGVPVGQLKASKPFVLDNPPRITLDPVDVRAFSPHPFDSAQHPREFSMTGTVSADADTQAQVQLELRLLNAAGATVASTPQSIAPGPFNAAWDGSTPTGLAPDGVYRAQLVATDKGSQETIAEETVRLDATSPRFTCIRLPFDSRCNPGSRDAPAGINVINGGPADATGETLSLRVPLTFEALGSGATEAHYHVFKRVLTGGFAAPWQAQPTGTIEVLHGQTVEVAVLAEDDVGNFECAAACTPARVPSSFAPSQIHDVVAAKRRGLFLGDGTFVAGTAILRADAAPPVLLESKINGEPFGETGQLRFGPASPVRIEGVAHEADSPPAVGHITILSIEDPALHYDNPVPGTPTGDANRYAFAWTDWPEAVRDWPEGAVAFLLVAQDAAGNPSSDVRGQMLLDRTPPQLIDDSVVVEYAQGREHAMPGDLVAVQLAAFDPALLLHTRQPNELRLALDATHVASGPVHVDSECAQGLFPASALPLCFDGFDAFRVTFRVPPPVSTEARAQRFLLDVVLDDGLGNVHLATGVVPIVVGEPHLQIADIESETDAHSITLRWTTARPASGAVRLTTTGLPTGPELGAGSSEDGTRHAVHLTGLHPATAYHVQIVARDPETGVAEIAGPITIVTGNGLASAFTNPAPGQAASGDLRIQWSTDVAEDVAGPIRYELLLVPGNPSLPPKALNEFEGGPGAREFVLVTPGLPDGDYHLLLKAVMGAEQTETSSGSFMIDNTPPTITKREPIPGASLGGPDFAIRVHARDGHSRVSCDSSATLNGNPLPIIACDDELLVFDPSNALDTGSNEATVTVRDGAGNQRTSAWTFTYDDAGPRLHNVTIHYPLDQSAAKPGDLVTIRANTSSAAGIRSIRIDATDLGVPVPVGLEPVSRDAWAAYFTLPQGAPQGVRDITMVAQDTLGRQARLGATVDIILDAPGVQRLQFLPSAEGAPRLVIETDQEAAVQLRWTTPAGEPMVRTASTSPIMSAADAADRFGAHILLAQAPIRPGSPFEVVTTGRAGNAATHRGVFDALDLTALPQPPTLLRLNAAGSMGPRLDWAASNGSVIGYALYRIDPSGDTSRFVVGSATQWTDTTSMSRGLHTYFLTSLDGAGRESAPSDAVTFDEAGNQVLTGSPASPARGTTETRFRFHVDVHLETMATPVGAWLLLNDVPYELSPAESSCGAVCAFELFTTLPPSDIQGVAPKFHYEVETTSGWLRYPAARDLDAPIVVEALYAYEERPAAPAGQAVFLALALAALVLHRRRNP